METASVRKSRFTRLIIDTYKYISSPSQIPLVYFDDLMNVGDVISPYLVEKIALIKPWRASTSIFPRLHGVGSILGSANYNSYVWGSGSIEGNLPRANLDPNKIFALRGKNTLNLLKTRYPIRDTLPLGDPALLMPNFFDPATKKKFRIGIIPHYVDYEKIKILTSGLTEDITIIDVREYPEAFISKLSECESILSSSLHGLILADAYKIPNAWIQLSDSIAGGSWKFMDYYSTTKNKKPINLQINNKKEFIDLINNSYKWTKTSDFLHSTEELLASFPTHLFR